MSNLLGADKYTNFLTNYLDEIYDFSDKKISKRGRQRTLAYLDGSWKQRIVRRLTSLMELEIQDCIRMMFYWMKNWLSFKRHMNVEILYI